MIFVTGDTHGDYDDLMERINKCGAGKEDYFIICGDFGFVWNLPEQNYLLARLSGVRTTILFVDGNHEDFDMLYTYPVEQWNGGSVHKIYDNVLHLMRGQLFEIEGKSFFTMGGAYSIDKALRREHISWWSQEKPSDEEYRTADETLERCGYKADYVLTHTLPVSAIPLLGISPDGNDARLTGYLEELYHKMSFKMWYAGHFHEDIVLSSNLRVLYYDIVTIGE